MKRDLIPATKKQHKRSKQDYRKYDDDYLGPKHPTRDNYKRKAKHRNNPNWDSDY